jgi:catechol 2,3-dioxygenase-like lactoylglutathione lyase family enzyme
MERLINGIQQVGIGVADAAVAFEWYKKYFGFDTIVFEDVAEASLMKRYTGGQVHQRYAVLAMNMQGGGGLEIWQYTSRRPKAPNGVLQLSNPGIFAIKIKCRNVENLYQLYQEQKVNIVSPIAENPIGQKHFFITDPFNNVFQMIEDDYWFQSKKGLTGGVCGAIIGVSNMQSAIQFYQHTLDYKMAYCEDQAFSDLKELSGCRELMSRSILKNTPDFCGAFSKLLGPTTIELIQSKTPGSKIFHDRYWGDLGFIHVCYDVCSMQSHRDICAENGFPLTVNSGDSFEMGEAAGQFAYNEDPDGTLVEYVETHKVPILKKLGWYLDLKKRKNTRPLPGWMIKCMGFSKKTLQLSLEQGETKKRKVEKTAILSEKKNKFFLQKKL